MILYHVTFKKNVPKILYYGILPNKGKVWRNYYGVKMGKAGVVFAWDNWDRAWKWAFKQWWDFGYKPTAIIKFDVDREYVSISETMHGKEYLVSGKIYPEQIKDVFMIELEKP